MFFVDAGYRRVVRRRRRGPGAGIVGDDRPARAEAAAATETPRIGIVTQDFAGAPEAAGAEALRVAAKAAERAGASVRTLAMPDIVAEAWRIHRWCSNSRRTKRSPGSTARITTRCRRCCAERLDESEGTTPADYDAARSIANRARKALRRIFDDVDVLLTFSAPGAAPKGLASTGDPRFNRLWTLMGVPCVNVPAYVAEGGLPVGVR